MGLETLPDGSTIIRLDDHRKRKIGSMVVSNAPEFDLNPFETLLEMEAMDGPQLLEQQRTEQATYATAPFDPEGDLLRFYPGGITIWSGFPGAGKTTILRQFMCHLLHRGSSVFLASLEEDPRAALVRLAATAAGQFPTGHQMQWFIDAYAERFRLWGVIGIASHKKLLSVARTLAAIGIEHVVIDSLMCLDVANDDLEAQRKFANVVAATARAARIHIHLVAHPRKPQRSDQPPDLNDVAGAREIGGIADNVIFIRRDMDRASYAQNSMVTPMAIDVCKQRHFSGALGDIPGWFNRQFKQFTRDQFAQSPTRYLPDDAFAKDHA